jgi:hypothetical protein
MQSASECAGYPPATLTASECVGYPPATLTASECAGYPPATAILGNYVLDSLAKGGE